MIHEPHTADDYRNVPSRQELHDAQSQAIKAVIEIHTLKETIEQWRLYAEGLVEAYVEERDGHRLEWRMS